MADTAAKARNQRARAKQVEAAARPKRQHILAADAAKAKVVDLIDKGETVEMAMLKAQRSLATWEYWRKSDKAFVEKIDRIRARRTVAVDGDREDLAGDFRHFCNTYLGHDLYWHQLQWIDMLDGNPPRDLHPSQTYTEGRKSYLLINTAPEHGKSTTLTVDYITYRICKDPTIRVKLISKTQQSAMEQLYSVQNRLTSDQYYLLQQTFAPADGFKKNAAAWTKTKIYLERQSSEKDPTIQALGIKGQIYGARANLIVMDDCADLGNAHDYDAQIRYITQDVMTRLGDRGQLLIVGTRVASMDLYSELRRPERWQDGHCEFTYLSQPAVLEFADDPKDWVTLWPQTNMPADSEDVPDADGMYTKWDGVALEKRRRAVYASPNVWPMVYMQQHVSDDTTFPSDAVHAAIDQRRLVGPITDSEWGRPRAMEGLYVVGGLDLASSGHTAATVLGVDRETKIRWVLDVKNRAGMTMTTTIALLKDLTEKYSVKEWRIEKNAYQTALTQWPELRQWLGARGVLLKEHYTGSNKWDSDIGVAAMSMLFMGHPEKPGDKNTQLIKLPGTRKNEAVKSLVEQLVTWFPSTRNKTDCVMSLWFAEIRAQELCRRGENKSHFQNKYLSPQQRASRMVINLDDWQAANAS